jgi:hypothetical protein
MRSLGISFGIALTLPVNLGRNDTSKIIHLLVHEHGTHPCLFSDASVSFNEVLLKILHNFCYIYSKILCFYW